MPADRERIELIVQQGLEAIREDGKSLESFLSGFPDLADELRPSLETALWLQQNQTALDASETFVQSSKARLLEQIAAESSAAAQNSASSFSWRVFWDNLRSWRFAYQLALALLIIVSLILTSSGVALAARNTIPGDTLYPVKRFEEKLQLAFSLSPDRDLRLMMEFAERRVLEMQELVLRNRLAYLDTTQESHSDLIAKGLELLRRLAQTDPARAQQLTREMTDSLAGQMAVLSSMFVSTPEFAQGTIETALAEVNAALGASQEIGDGISLESTSTPTPTASATRTRESSPTAAPVLSSTPTPTPSNSPTSEIVEVIEDPGTPAPNPTSGVVSSPTPVKTKGGSGPNPSPTATPTNTQLPPDPPVLTDTPETPLPTIRTKPPGPTDQPTPTQGPKPTKPVPPKSTPRPTQTPLPPPTQGPHPTATP